MTKRGDEVENENDHERSIIFWGARNYYQTIQIEYFILGKFHGKNALTLLPGLMGTRRISYQDLREKREAHEKKQSEIEYICLHFGAIVDPILSV